MIILQEYYLDRPSTTTSLAKNNIFNGDNVYSVPTLENTCEENREINEITKDFSTCANTFGNSPANTKNASDLMCGQPTAPPEIYGEDETAKDCL